MNKTPPSVAQLLTMTAFALSCFVLLLFLWVAFGGSTPLKPDGYRFTVPFKEAGQLAQEADVRISGVRVGTVKKIEAIPETGRSNVTVQMEPEYSPIPVNSRAMLRSKTLLGETYLELTPGNPDGPFLPDDGTLPRGNIKPSVELDEIIQAFDPATRAAFQVWQQQQAIAGLGRGRDINDAFAEFAPLEQEVTTLGETLNSNAPQLSRLFSSTGTVFASLSARDSQLRSLIENSNAVFSTTADRNQQLAETFVALPAFQRESRATLARLVRFADDTNPVVTQLQPVALQLDPTMKQLNRFAPQLDGLFTGLGPAINAADTGLPATDAFLAEAAPFLGAIDPLAANFNPLFQYLGPYKQELTAFVANVAAATNAQVNLQGKQVKYARLVNRFAPEALATYPERVKSIRSNPYPLPGAFRALATSSMPVYQNGNCTTGISPGLSASAVDSLGPTLSARVSGYSFNDNVNTLGDPNNVAAPGCGLQGPVYGGKYYPQLIPGARTPQLVP
ncbi:MAG: MCE family protein [Acidobacteria bacterium]|nr:MCE family protein [Acidobacteriota bacterium]